ncbi:hypothetical protein [Aureibacter tunicatorum]|uniref:Lipoprotein n=1 Tax=Aureibacter tunicatorum TaxID=866807 RepID=A0AAE3XIM6_9BACT|nr:hypothetical protein [Aureibacter tunicatorum]MDR6237125.1 hypothetical protein [Aureibacter tunicatorum]
MMKLSIYILLAATFNIFGCNAVEQHEERKSPYFSSKKFVEDQIELLDSLRPKVSKEATLNGTSEKVILRGNKVVWEDELAIYANADITDPSLEGMYKVAVIDKPSGGRRIQYTLDTAITRENTVKSLEIDSLEGKVVSIKAHLMEDNGLFVADRHLKMKFDDKGLLEEYIMSSDQKILTQEQVLLNVKGEIISQ